jgi:hypothetical protein
LSFSGLNRQIIKLLGAKRRLNAESSMLKAIKKEMMLKD